LTLGKAAASGDATPVIAPAESRELLAAWRRCGEDRATGGEAKGHWGSALAGEGEPHAWFLGIAPSTGEPAYATAVLIERAADPERALEVGVALLQAAAQR
jgi:hypothetical protein